MQNRLSLADLKAKASASVLTNTEIYSGGESNCHVYVIAQPPRDGVIIQAMIPRK